MNKEDEKKIPVTVEQVRQFLKENQDPEYREFHSKLLPGTENIMGVRLPILRKFAKQLAAQAWKDWFEQADDQWYEETMLRGLVVAYARMDCEERLKYVRKFVPDINSWGVCDCFCSTLKDADKYPQEYWEFIEPYLTSEKEYEARFAAVMLLGHFETRVSGRKYQTAGEYHTAGLLYEDGCCMGDICIFRSVSTGDDGISEGQSRTG